MEKFSTTRQTRGDNITGPVHCAWWNIKATNTHSQYVTFIAFPRQQQLQERASVLFYTYIARFVYFQFYISLLNSSPEVHNIRNFIYNSPDFVNNRCLLHRY